MNDKSRMILKMLVGGYILYIGVSLLIGVLQTEPNEKILMIIVSIFFMAVGGSVLYLSVRALLKERGIDIDFWKRKQKNVEMNEDEEAEQTDSRMPGGNSNVNLQDLSQDAKEKSEGEEEASGQQGETGQEEKAEQEAGPETESEEKSREEIEESDQEEGFLDPEEDPQGEMEAESGPEEKEETDDRVTDAENAEDAEDEDSGKIEEYEAGKEELRKQASISPMPQRK